MPETLGTTTPLDQELPEGIDRVLSLRDRLRSACEGLGPGQLNWRPSEERWSVGECLLHMTRTNQLYLEKVDEAMSRGRARGQTGQGPFRYNWFSRWFVAQVEPSSTRRLPAPAIFRPPQREVGPEIVSELAGTLDQLVDTMRAAGGLDLARIKVWTPVRLPLRLNLGAAFRLLAAHTDRHLGQVEGVLRAPGFPASH